jgi:hypothetical protein
MVSIQKGTTAKFSFSFPEYPPADWDAIMIINAGAVAQQFPSTVADGSFHVKITPAQSSALHSGTHQFVLRVTKKNDSTEVANAKTGELFIENDITFISDTRTRLEKDLDAVDAAITAILEGGAVHSYEIQTNVGKRSLERMSLADLRKHRMWIRGQIDEERVRLGLKPRTASMKKTFKFCP